MLCIIIICDVGLVNFDEPTVHCSTAFELDGQRRVLWRLVRRRRPGLSKPKGSGVIHHFRYQVLILYYMYCM